MSLLRPRHLLRGLRDDFNVGKEHEPKITASLRDKTVVRLRAAVRQRINRGTNNHHYLSAKDSAEVAQKTVRNNLQRAGFASGEGNK